MGYAETLQPGQEVAYTDVTEVYKIRTALEKVDRDQQFIVFSSKRIIGHRMKLKESNSNQTKVNGCSLSGYQTQEQ